MKDLSQMARNGPWITSQAGGNMTSSTAGAMTAQGSQPVDPLPDRSKQGDPELAMSDTVPVGGPPNRITETYVASAIVWTAIP
jgi:hypothetical protein